MTEATIKKKTSGDLSLIARELRSCRLGIDSEGMEHVWHRGGNSVVVADESGVERHQNLGERTLAEWRYHVAEKRGWQRMGPFAAAAMRADHVRKKEARR